MSRQVEFRHAVKIAGDGYVTGMLVGTAHCSPEIGDAMRCTLAAARQLAGLLKLRNKLPATVVAIPQQE